MLKPTLLALLVSMTTSAFAQGGSVTGALNQIKKDPAQQGFEKEYDDLQKTIGDLDKPSKKQSEEERESKLPSHKVKTDYKKR